MRCRGRVTIALVGVFVLPLTFRPVCLQAARGSAREVAVPAIGDLPIGRIGEKDLMSDEIFMQGLWGMKIEGVEERGDRIVIATTGAEFELQAGESRILCRQRLGKERRSVSIALGDGALAGLRVAARGTGAVVLASAAGVQIKVNCDSLLMLRVASEADVTCSVPWEADMTYGAGSSRLIMDPFGAVGLFPIRGEVALEKGKGAGEWTYKAGAGAELWVSVGPPRAYRWKDSLEQRLIWQGSWTKPELAVPGDEKIEKWFAHGNILWLQSEKMLYKTWYHTDFFPQLPEEFGRVIETTHRLGRRVIAYASPFYFVKGIDRGPSGKGTNVGAYLEEVADFLKRYPTLDGIYFDGVYPGSVENTYRVCRATRALLGDEKILEIHCTGNAPGRRCYNPAADTYANFILRGEGQGFIGEEWLRYFVSGYNISNAVGVVCNNAGHWMPTERQVAMTLRANCRLAYMPFDADEWPDGGKVRIVNLRPEEVERRHRAAMSAWYWPRLDGGYREWFEGINAKGDFKLPPPPPGPPPHPVAGLTLGDVMAAAKGRLVLESFGADAPEYRSVVLLNGVELGDLPASKGDRWSDKMSVALPKEALGALGASNELTIKNLDKDAFKVRSVYLELTLADGRRASSNLVSAVYCSAGGWAYQEGHAVPLGEPLVIRIPIPVPKK